MGVDGKTLAEVLIAQAQKVGEGEKLPGHTYPADLGWAESEWDTVRSMLADAGFGYEPAIQVLPGNRVRRQVVRLA